MPKQTKDEQEANKERTPHFQKYQWQDYGLGDGRSRFIVWLNGNPYRLAEIEPSLNSVVLYWGNSNDYAFADDAAAKAWARDNLAEILHAIFPYEEV